MADFKHLDALLDEFVKGPLPGCACQIAQNGETLYENYAGFADIENKIPITRESVFRMASMSKIPLYVTCMMLFERGKFLLSDPIHKYFPEWKDLKKFEKTPSGKLETVPVEGHITIRDILSMKCGLPYCNFAGPTDNETEKTMQKHMQPLWEKGYYTIREQIKAMSQATLAFEPGTHWLYGFSSELAAGLVEAVCDRPIDDVFEDYLFKPLGMDSTRSRFFGDIQKRMVELYFLKDGGAVEKGKIAFDEKHLPGKEHETGWARLFSNVNDFTKIMQMLANGGFYGGERLMGRKTIDLMRTNGLNDAQQKDFDGDGVYNLGYGYGYGVRTLIDKYRGGHNGSLGAFGWTGGFGTWCEADPDERLSVVYMHNLMPNMEEYYHLRLRNTAYGCLK